MIFIFEIYDKRLKEWYIDYTTKDEKIAEEYFNILIKTYPKYEVRIITQFDI